MAKKTAAKTKAAVKKPAAKPAAKAALTPWEIVQIARHAERPNISDYIELMCEDFVELHGDRLFGDDRGMIGGFATIGGQKVVLIGHRKGRGVEENIEANFGMASPEGYRKAKRLMTLAAKYKLPVVALVDTPGAYPGSEAEARGQAEAIAHNLEFMSTLKTPMVVVITGEGGSGGALGIAVGDRILMLQNAVYSVISPEGCASILWRDGTKASLAAEALKITAESLKSLGVIDAIIPEPKGGAHTDKKQAVEAVKQAIVAEIVALKKVGLTELVDARYAKFAAMGRFA